MKLDEETAQIVKEAALEASRDAVRQVREHGLPLTVVIGGRVVKTYSDGRTVIKSSVEASKLKLTKGTILVFDKATRGLGKETLALLTLLGLSSRDVAAGRVSSLAEVLSEIRNVDPIKEGNLLSGAAAWWT